MTEESASENEDVIHQHKLSWRSQGLYTYNCNVMQILFIDLELNRLVRKLDRRRKKNIKQGGFRSKPRQLSTASELPPPSNYVEWAVTLQEPSDDEQLALSKMTLYICTQADLIHYTCRHYLSVSQFLKVWQSQEVIHLKAYDYHTLRNMYECLYGAIDAKLGTL